ncbi:MAG: BT4734/BF3469 family protein [Candidatus Scalindua sp.]|jgi:hypothetical protein|nr:BT4734/BF3469 family protein [Candidatus Scalindua sp.]
MKTEVSCFKSADKANPFCTADINKILDMIKTGKWKDKVERFRNTKDVEKRSKIKKTILPGFTTSGTFHYRKSDNLIRHSGFISLDLDHLEDVERVKLKLKQDPYVYAMFTSVSDQGLAVIVRIEADPAKHYSAFKALEKHHLEKYGLKVDSQCKDICRLRYISWDADLYFNREAEVFKNYIESNGKRHENNQTCIEDVEKMICHIEHVVSQVEKKRVVLGDDSYNEWLRVGFAIASELQEKGRKYFHRISSVSNKYDPVACDKQYDQCIREYRSEKRITIATFFNYAKKAGLEIAKPDKKTSQCVNLLEIASALPLFHDENKEAYAFLNNEVVSLRSRKIKQYLSYKMYKTKGMTPNSDSLNQTITTLEGKAIYENSKKELFNRVAQLNGAIWYDLGDGKAVKITKAGWNIENSPILFRRYSHQQAQSTPVGGSNPWKIFNSLNVDKENQLLVLVYIISCFIPDIPHPIFHPHGSQGAGKTTLCKVIKKICDPSSIETLITPKEITQLTQVISHHHVCLFDNMSDLPTWMSDLLAQACTGGGFSKRQLYTDDEDVIYQVKRCIGLNGINLLVSKPDLMDRTILLHLERIAQNKRVDEKELWKLFEREKPEIIGGIFDTLAKAMDIYPNVNLIQLPRMADFAKWGYAIAEALGHKGSEFIKAYQQNVERQNEEVIQHNTLALAVVAFMNDKDTWSGTIKEAWKELREIANPEKKDSSFPKASRTLRNQLEKIKPNLMDIGGITFEIGARNMAGYPITFEKDDNFNSLYKKPVDSLCEKETECLVGML